MLILIAHYIQAVLHLLASLRIMYTNFVLNCIAHCFLLAFLLAFHTGSSQVCTSLSGTQNVLSRHWEHFIHVTVSIVWNDNAGVQQGELHVRFKYTRIRCKLSYELLRVDKTVVHSSEKPLFPVREKILAVHRRRWLTHRWRNWKRLTNGLIPKERTRNWTAKEIQRFRDRQRTPPTSSNSFERRRQRAQDSRRHVRLSSYQWWSSQPFPSKRCLP